MFLAFSMSMTLLVALLCYITPWPIGVFVLAPIYGGMYIASMWYDNIDGLKIGLDSTLLKFSRASLAYYQKHGYVTPTETQGEMYGGQVRSDKEIARFNHFIAMLERALSMLETKHSTNVANRLIAESTHHLYSLLSLYQEVSELREDPGFSQYLAEAHTWEQDDVDDVTIKYLLIIIDHLNSVFGDDAIEDINAARAQITAFSAQREQAKQEGRPARTSENGAPAALVAQDLADYMFTQVFYQLLSVIKVHRQKFFKRITSSE